MSVPPAAEQRPSGLAWAAAWILAYQDRNGNGAFERSEIIGGTRDAMVVWAERDLTANESPTHAPLAIKSFGPRHKNQRCPE